MIGELRETGECTIHCMTKDVCFVERAGRVRGGVRIHYNRDLIIIYRRCTPLHCLSNAYLGCTYPC